MNTQRNLLILYQPEFQAQSDWETVRNKVHERAPDIEARVLDSSSTGSITKRWQGKRPSLVFSPLGLGAYRAPRGTIVLSRSLAELDQYARLSAAGIAVPRTIKLMPGMALKPEIWGEFVIAKPHGGGRKRDDLRFLRTDQIGQRYRELAGTPGVGMLIKQYIHGVDEAGYPVEYRALAMFGTVLHAFRTRIMEKRPPLAEFAKDYRSIPSSDSLSMNIQRERTLTFDSDVIAMARAAAATFPEVACVGIDMLRDAETGKLYVIELNAGGHTWNMSGRHGQTYDPLFRRSLYDQFNALDLVADLLVEKTRAEAS